MSKYLANMKWLKDVNVGDTIIDLSRAFRYRHGMLHIPLWTVRYKHPHRVDGLVELRYDCGRYVRFELVDNTAAAIVVTSDIDSSVAYLQDVVAVADSGQWELRNAVEGAMLYTTDVVIALNRGFEMRGASLMLPIWQVVRRDAVDSWLCTSDSQERLVTDDTMCLRLNAKDILSNGVLCSGYVKPHHVFQTFRKGGD